MQVIGMLTVIRGVPERLNVAASCADNLVCLTNYVQAREINCATFCWCRRGLRREVFWHEKGPRNTEGLCIHDGGDEGIEPLTS